MECLIAIGVAVKCRNSFIMSHPGTSKVDIEEYIYLNFYILIVKSMFMLFAANHVMPKYLTIGMMLTSFVDVARHIVHIKPHEDKYTITEIDVALDRYVQFLIDFYNVTALVLYLFKFYDEEREKAITLISFTLCLDWYIDTYQGKNPLHIIDVIITFLFLVFALIALKPLDNDYDIFYVFICLALVFWVRYKYYIIASTHGMSEYCLVYPDLSWKDELINTIELYVYYVLKYYGLYTPSMKKNAYFYLFPEAKKTYVCSFIDLPSNKSLPSFAM